METNKTDHTQFPATPSNCCLSFSSRYLITVNIARTVLHLSQPQRKIVIEVEIQSNQNCSSPCSETALSAVTLAWNWFSILNEILL